MSDAASGTAGETGFLPVRLQPTEPAAQAQFEARSQRLMDLVAGHQPDRMPVVMYATFWLAKYAGISCKELMYNYEGTKDIALRAIQEFDPDIAAPGMMAANVFGPSMELLDFKQLQWPGHGVGEHQPYQYLDREYMFKEEYEQLMADPTGFYLRKYLPRVSGALEGLADMPDLPGMYYFRLISGLRGFNKPSVRQALMNLLKVAEEVDVMTGHIIDFSTKLTNLGYPRDSGSNGVSPYDYIADYLRGARGMMTDLFRKKDQLMALLDRSREWLTRIAIDNAKMAGHPIVMIPIHWAPDAFMSDKVFREVYWPPFRQMLCDMIDAGLIPMPLWEADCSKRLEIIKDVPRGKCIYWFERTPLTLANEVLEGQVALRGNLSPSMMTTGTPDDVDAAVKHLVDNVWNKGGRLLLDCAFGIPDETPVPNVRAMFDAARKYAG